MINLIDTFLAMDEVEVIMAQADKARPVAERKIAQCIASFREVTGYAEIALARADTKIAAINGWNTGKAMWSPADRAFYRFATVGRTDIRRDLEDAEDYRTAAAEWMDCARKVESDPSLVAA